MLLLPLQSTAFARPAEALREGFFAAHKVAGDDVTLQVVETDESPDQIGAALAAARERGITVVVGPLARGAVDAMSSRGTEPPCRWSRSIFRSRCTGAADDAGGRAVARSRGAVGRPHRALASFVGARSADTRPRSCDRCAYRESGATHRQCLHGRAAERRRGSAPDRMDAGHRSQRREATGDARARGCVPGPDRPRRGADAGTDPARSPGVRHVAAECRRSAHFARRGHAGARPGRSALRRHAVAARARSQRGDGLSADPTEPTSRPRWRGCTRSASMPTGSPPSG